MQRHIASRHGQEWSGSVQGFIAKSSRAVLRVVLHRAATARYLNAAGHVWHMRLAGQLVTLSGQDITLSSEVTGIDIVDQFICSQ